MTGPTTTDTRTWAGGVPKVDLHVHLEGAIPPDALWALVERYGDPGVTERAALEARFRYRDFDHFIATWWWKQGFLRTLDDLELVAAAVARDLIAQHVRHAELICSPSDVAQHGLAPADVVTAFRRGLETAGDLDAGLVVDLVRDTGPDAAARTLEAVAEAREDAGIVGITIGGSEAAFPPEPFAPVFQRARALGLHTSAHAGEAAGPASVRGALDALRVDRIGHGVRAVEDPALVGRLAAERVPLEVCPGSNVATGVVATLDEHPVRGLLDAGCVVTIGSDDPAMFGTSLAGEYTALVERLGCTRGQVRDLVLAAVDAAWLDDTDRHRLHAEIAGSSAWEA